MTNKRLNPDLYHGHNKTSDFFEGWYFKITDEASNLSLAFIPGIIKGKEKYSFIQYINGIENQFEFFQYPEEDFNASKNRFEISIQNNSFSLEGIHLSLSGNTGCINVNLDFNSIFKWPDSKINPGSMGFYNYLSFMECYSQVCTLDGTATGEININDKKIILSNAKVYIEKNWGKKFPYSWFWIQSNSFKNQIALTCSIAHIPFPLGSFRGFLIGLKLNDSFIKFTTINRSKLNIIKKEKDIKLIAVNKRYELTVEPETSREEFLMLHGPTGSNMHPYVKESITSKVKITLKSKADKKLILEETGAMAGIEYGGNFEKLFF